MRVLEAELLSSISPLSAVSMLDELFERAARADDDQVIAAVVLEGAVERQHKSRGGRELGELRSASATYTLLWNENSLPLPVVANTLLTILTASEE